MDKRIVSFLLMLLWIPVQAQDVFGKWRTIDDATQEGKSIVDIYLEKGKLYGKIIEIFDKDKEAKLCDKCPGINKNRPVLGMVIINGLSENGDTWDGGTILDPEKGKDYKCAITLENKDRLKVRGYIGFSLLGRTQYWERAE